MSLNQNHKKHNPDNSLPNAEWMAIQWETGRTFYEMPLANGIGLTSSETVRVVIDPITRIKVGDYILAWLKSGHVFFGQLTRQNFLSIEISCLTEEEELPESNHRYIKYPFDPDEILHMHKIRMIMFR